MTDIIKHKYYVGEGQPYSTANQAIQEIATALFGGDYELPDTDLPDGGNIHIIFRGGGLHPPIKIPDGMTAALAEEAVPRTLLLRRKDYVDDAQSGNGYDRETLPIISAVAPSTRELDLEDRIIGIDIGSNNPNIKIRGLRVEGFVIGIRASFNCHRLELERSFIVNNLNTQVYVRDCSKVYVNNNVIVGGEFGLVLKFVKKFRVYHNTIFVDGQATLGGTPKAGLVLQAERLFGETTISKSFCLGNLVYTIGCPPAIFYEEDLTNNRLVSNYNDFYASDQPLIQLRQDSATLSEEEEVVVRNYYNLQAWSRAGIIPGSTDEFGHVKGIDSDSISSHPVFISNVQGASHGSTSILDLSLVNNSPILEKVPSWYEDVDSIYIPDDFEPTLNIDQDSLLNRRETPFTAIGANDFPSANGFFGTDIFTSPLLDSRNRVCNVDPLLGLTKQNVDMVYPHILAGYFYSNERPYYLYAKKGAYQLGFLVKSTFNVPAFFDKNKPITVTSRALEVEEENWDIAGDKFVVYHRDYGVSSYSDEVTIEGWIKKWSETESDTYGFTFEKAFYAYKLTDGEIQFALPDDFVSTAPVVVTDDRVSYRDPIEIVRRDFSVEFSEKDQESFVVFHGDRNLFENPQFDITSDGLYPQGWVVPKEASTFMVGRDYAYIGELATALSATSTAPAGQIISNPISIQSGDAVTVSWHSRIPEGVQSGKGLSRVDVETSMIGEYKVNFLDHNKNTIGALSGEFTADNSDYQRYYVTFGPDNTAVWDNVQNKDNINITWLASGVNDIPNGTTEMSLMLKAQTLPYTGAMLFVDGCQAEYSPVPTTFHQKPSLHHMTVEFETDTSNVFIDKRMNLTPLFNENPNGFLYIADMPAKIWGGPEDIETTSLHEYRWPEGRLYHLPWARLHGKDKLTFRVGDADEPIPPYDIIEPFSLPRRAVTANMTPSTMLTVQGTQALEGLSVEVLDEIGNPYGLRNYTLSVLDENNNFPGYLSKNKFGAKEQLGTTVFGSLSEHGSVNAFYVPPSEELVRYVGQTPSVFGLDRALSGLSDSMSYIETNYSVSLTNNGNITVIGSGGNFHPVSSEEFVTGQYSSVANQNRGSYVSLEYPPVFGSVELVRDSVRYQETLGDPNDKEFAVDYPNAQLVLPAVAIPDVPVYIKYQPKYAYPDPNDQGTIIFHHNKVFGQYTGPIQVDYDAELFLEITAQQLFSGEYTNTFPVVVQNPKLSELTDNSLSLEY